MTTSQRTVRDLALAIPGATRVFERMGIDYCCGGGRTLDEACAKAGVDRTDVLAALVEATVAAGRPADTTDWMNERLTDLVKHIVDTHHAFVKTELPRLDALAEKVARKHGEHHPELVAIRERFRALQADLLSHLEKEEVILFPYVEAMEGSNPGAARVPACFGAIEGPIGVMTAEHDVAGEILRELRALSSGYAVPEDACMSYRGLYEGLVAFERDLHEHIHLENNVLFPRAIEMEQQAGARRA